MNPVEVFDKLNEAAYRVHEARQILESLKVWTWYADGPPAITRDLGILEATAQGLKEKILEHRAAVVGAVRELTVNVSQAKGKTS